MKKFSWEVPENFAQERLDKTLYEFLQKKFPLSRSKIRKLIIAGAVYVNNRRVRIAGKTIFARDKIKIYVDERKFTSSKKNFSIKKEDILYEDEWFIFLNKPAGLLTVPSVDEARDCLYNLVKEYLKKRDNKNQVYLGVHHRLDAETSGVIVFSKKEEINKPLSEIFQEHLIKKTYYALSYKENPIIEKKWEIRNEIIRSHFRKNIFRVAKEDEEGSFAYSQFSLLEENANFALIEAIPITGRTHQIRVQLAHYGLPILGDKIYGKTKEIRLMLHAYSLSFRHPILDKEIKIQAEVDDEWRKVCEKRGILYFTNPSKSEKQHL